MKILNKEQESFTFQQTKDSPSTATTSPAACSQARHVTHCFILASFDRIMQNCQHLRILICSFTTLFMTSSALKGSFHHLTWEGNQEELFFFFCLHFSCAVVKFTMGKHVFVTCALKADRQTHHSEPGSFLISPIAKLFRTSTL